MKVVLVGAIKSSALKVLSVDAVEIVASVPKLSDLNSIDFEFEKVVVLPNGISAATSLDSQLRAFMDWKPQGVSVHLIIKSDTSSLLDSIVESSEGWVKKHVVSSVGMSLLTSVCNEPNPEDEEVEEDVLDSEAIKSSKDKLEVFEREDVKVVVLVGARQGSGTSFVANNLATLIGRKGKLTALVECTNEKSDLERFVGEPNLNTDVGGLVKRNNVFWIPHWNTKKSKVSEVLLGEVVLIDVGHDMEEFRELASQADEILVVSESIPTKSSKEIQSVIDTVEDSSAKVKIVWNKLDGYNSVFGEGVGEESTVAVALVEPALASKADSNNKFLVELEEATSEIPFVFEELILSVV